MMILMALVPRLYNTARRRALFMALKRAMIDAAAVLIFLSLFPILIVLITGHCCGIVLLDAFT